MNEADFYIDFPKQPELKGLDEAGNVVAYRLKQLVQKIRYRARRLMPVECERLDGFPDGWTLKGASGKEMSDTTRYTALGNSIAVPCAERIMIGILAAEQEETEHEEERDGGANNTDSDNQPAREMVGENGSRRKAAGN